MQNRPALQVLLIAIGFTLATGCQGPWPAGKHAQDLSSPTPHIAKLEGNAETILQTSTTDPAVPTIPGQDSSAKTQEEAMAEVLGELEEIGAIDPEAKQVLLDDLKNAKPENWSMIVKQFQSALAYRQQLAARESKTPTDKSFPPLKSTTPPTRQASFELPKKTAAIETPAKSSSPLNTEPETTAVVVSDDSPLEQTPTNNVATNTVAMSNVAMQSAKPLPKPTISTRPQATAVAAPTHHTIEQVSYAAPIATADNWQGNLQAAITKLEQTAKQAPSNTDEVHDHMRLRMLRMLAGEKEKALMPIPGASTMQQDYWAKQLFAMSAFLDSQGQPDDKRRAATSLLQLDQARASLSEMATLQVRNLTFVESVDGYGVYQPRAEAKFQPGDQVTLYTEIGNFRSESTKDGYRTTLQTSYEVLDTKGQRVDSAQFPDIEDICKNRRHDFHMQYGVALPTRIYAGEYELRITVTDQLSHKISQLSVPFEIIE
ncbi:MAG: hypothetical protein GXP26_07725 [Planctomycetes bacterium]|nr:hypothetical protein [Planctomycetota bacterium]